MAGVVHPLRADGAPVRRHRRGPGDRRVRGGDAARHRLRRRALHAPGGPWRARRHLREARAAVGPSTRPRGTSATSCCPTTSTGSGDNLMRAFERFPALEKAGLKQIINGPFTFTPDGNPLVGPVPEVKNYWAACGVLAGFSQGGGVGLALANWMIDGDPGMDTWAMDVTRFGDYAGPAYSRAMARQTYATRFLVPFPNEERPAGRPLRRTPIHDRLKAKGAIFGAAFGLEQALWVRPAGHRGGRDPDLPPFQRARPGGRGVPRGARRRRDQRDLRFRQVRDHRTRRRAVAQPAARQPDPRRRAHGALADAQHPGARSSGTSRSPSSARSGS